MVHLPLFCYPRQFLDARYSLGYLMHAIFLHAAHTLCAGVFPHLSVAGTGPHHLAYGFVDVAYFIDSGTAEVAGAAAHFTADGLVKDIHFSRIETRLLNKLSLRLVWDLAVVTKDTDEALGHHR